MEKEKTTTKGEKSRYWAFCLYPESALMDWRSQLRQNAVPCAISPLHDRDVYDKDEYDDNGILLHKKGDLLKPHYHILFAFNGPTTLNNIKMLSGRCGGTVHIEKVGCCKGYYQYLWHRNDHDKFQYNEADVETLCGFNIANFGLTSDEADKIITSLEELIEQEGWSEYKTLMRYLRVSGMGPEYRVARCQTYYFREIFAGIRRESEKMAAKVNPSTGEVMT